jgi:hypothetical protein
MLAVLSRYKLAAEILAALALLAALLWGFNRFCEAKRDEGREEVRLQWGRANLAREQAETKIAALQTANRDLAVAQGEQREKAINTAVAASAAAVVSLRSTIASQQAQLATASVETNREYSRIAGTVFAECSERYRGMAEAAERNANAARTLSDAWPKQ